jgi:hypothetical protein
LVDAATEACSTHPFTFLFRETRRGEKDSQTDTSLSEVGVSWGRGCRRSAGASRAHPG